MDRFDDILASVGKPVNGSAWILTYDKLDVLEGPEVAVSRCNCGIYGTLMCTDSLMFDNAMQLKCVCSLPWREGKGETGRRWSTNDVHQVNTKFITLTLPTMG